MLLLFFLIFSRMFLLLFLNLLLADVVLLDLLHAGLGGEVQAHLAAPVNGRKRSLLNVIISLTCAFEIA